MPTIFDRVMETTNTTGTEALLLNGPVVGYRSFLTTVGITGETYYCIQHDASGTWEIGRGTLSSADTLERTEIIASSNSNLIVNLPIGEKLVFVTLPSVLLNDVSGSDKNYVHNQSAAAATWIVDHNLNKFPAITIVDSAGSKVYGDIVYITTNRAELRFSAAFSGKAYFN